jgi:hypothetical protein
MGRLDAKRRTPEAVRPDAGRTGAEDAGRCAIGDLAGRMSLQGRQSLPNRGQHPAAGGRSADRGRRIMVQPHPGSIPAQMSQKSPPEGAVGRCPAALGAFVPGGGSAHAAVGQEHTVFGKTLMARQNGKPEYRPCLAFPENNSGPKTTGAVQSAGVRHG